MALHESECGTIPYDAVRDGAENEDADANADDELMATPAAFP